MEEKKNNLRLMNSEELKPSYEELENINSQLSNENTFLKQRFLEVVNNKQIEQVYARLNFLFRVLEQKDAFAEGFVKKCATEVENLITIPEDNSEE